MLLGEALALSILSNQSNNDTEEDFDGFVITKFGGTTVTRVALPRRLPIAPRSRFHEHRKRFLRAQFSETLLRYRAGDAAQRETAAR
jgi:hypothetical protein